MTIQKITKRISITPDLLNRPDLRQCVMEILDREKKQLNSKKNGYVISIESIQKVYNIVSRETQDIFLDVDFTVESLLLRPGKILMPRVKMILSTGILATFFQIKIWIPKEELQGYKFRDKYFEKDGSLIEIGDEIQIRVIVTRYEKKTFSCIGRLTT